MIMDPKLDAIDNCGFDNYGMPLQNRRAPTAKVGRFAQEISNPCASQFVTTRAPMSKALKMATMIHYNNSKDYDNFVATDWVPGEYSALILLFTYSLYCYTVYLCVYTD